MICGGYFDTDKKILESEDLEKISNSSDFWNDISNANKVMEQLSNLKKSVYDVKNLKKSINDDISLCMLLEEDYDSDLFLQLNDDILNLSKVIDDLELKVLLSKEYDHCDCILDVHSGAGGTEACDWASMLFRMYNRWATSKNYKVEVIDYQEGDEVGIKRASILVKGDLSYGYLKCEKGVHRLVRLSPFDANNKRHTSFASVLVTPIFNNTVDIDIKPTDLKIDVYRSTGAGGQGVNTTDSAVRITYLPLKIVVTCQNERSQLKNKEKALEILKNKLKLIEIEKQEQELKSIQGESLNIEFGSQIRSYVMHPYSMVKDHRTDVETSDVNGVLDGDIDMFIEAYLRRKNG